MRFHIRGVLLTHRAIVWAIAIFCLWGCVSNRGSSELRDENTLQKISIGTTTKLGVFDLLGQPHNVNVLAESVQSEWIYFSERSYVHWASLIPVVGYLSSGTQSNKVVARITFNPDGTVSDLIVTDANTYLNSWVALHRVTDTDLNPSTNHIQVEMQYLGLPFDEEAAAVNLLYMDLLNLEQ